MLGIASEAPPTAAAAVLGGNRSGRGNRRRHRYQNQLRSLEVHSHDDGRFRQSDPAYGMRQHGRSSHYLNHDAPRVPSRRSTDGECLAAETVRDGV